MPLTVKGPTPLLIRTAAVIVTATATAMKANIVPWYWVRLGRTMPLGSGLPRQVDRGADPVGAPRSERLPTAPTAVGDGDATGRSSRQSAQRY